jgi:phosphate transport system permease protein
MKNWIKTGAPWIWITASAISVSLIAILLVLLLIGWKGLNYFWPMPIYEWETVNQQTIIGQVYQTTSMTPSAVDEERFERLTVKVANKEVNQADFIAIDTNTLVSETLPTDIAVLKRRNNGDFFGKVTSISTADGVQNKDLSEKIALEIERADIIRDEIDELINTVVRPNGWRLEELEKTMSSISKWNALPESERELIQGYVNDLKNNLINAENYIQSLVQSLSDTVFTIEDMNGTVSLIPLSDVLDAWYPNNMSYVEKWQHWAGQMVRFLVDDPREANSEGGVFPAIFGTILLVLIMSIIVMPLGVLGAVYLHEYAKDNRFTRILRIAVVNLAGVPSIVYGVFGLGFFVYTLGGSIDQVLFSNRLPAPTFGTPGLLWSALTMALMTLPVVIVSTEEGLARVPQSIRDGSSALGATQFETIWHLVLPMARPALLTGLILAVARAAGEVAPLMLVGVAKLAPTLPIDGQFPYLHLERNFMHLGFHIYDVGFQTSNIEAARPLVYATSFLLVTVIIGLNMTAIRIRNSLRERYQSFEAS